MTACEERYFGGEQNVSTNQSTFTTIYNQDTLAGNDSANCPLCCSLLFPFQQACLSSQVVIRCTCCSSCFPYVSKKTQQRLAAFPENAARKSCSLLFPLQQACLSHRLLYVVLVVQVVFPISAKRPSKKPQHKVLTNQLTPD